MFYYMVKYSFDPHKHVVGPFSTEEEAWLAMEKAAYAEFQISQKESDANTDYLIYEAEKEIVMIDHYSFGDNTTEWFVFEL